MPLIAIIFGVLLIPVGLVIYLDTKAPTALIPVVLGSLLALLGALAFKAGWRKHAMHVAALLGLFGLGGAAFRAIPAFLAWWPVRESTPMSEALIGTSITSLICLVFVALCVNSFIQARRRRAQSQE